MGSWFSSCSVAPDSSIDSLTDEDLYELIQKRIHRDNAFLPSEDIGFFNGTVWRLTADAVVKRTSSPTEVFMMSYVSSHTSIPIPKVRRVLLQDPSDPDWETWWIVMDFVDGEVLFDAWKSMTIWRKVCTMWFVRRYIRELQRTPIPNPDKPGPFDASGRSYICRGNYFTEDGAGPFNSYSAMAAWFDRRRFDTLAYRHTRCGMIDHCPKFDASHPLVLCHMDLHMRNLIVDRSGRLWMVDWANAGAFPPWLEYAHMVMWGSRYVRKRGLRAPQLWTWFARFMVGDYREYKTGYLDKLRRAFQGGNYDQYSLDYFNKLGLKVD